MPSLRMAMNRISLVFLLGMIASNANGKEVGRAERAFLTVRYPAEGMAVFIDSVFAGWTPLDSLPVAKGRHEIVLRHPDPWVWDSVHQPECIEMSAGEHRVVTFFPAAKGRVPATGKAGKFSPMVGVPEKPQASFGRTWKWRFGIAAALSGISALAFKQMADRSFERYSRAGHPDDMNRHFKKAELFDRISGGCYLLAELNLGAAVYSLYREIRGFRL